MGKHAGRSRYYSELKKKQRFIKKKTFQNHLIHEKK